MANRKKNLRKIKSSRARIRRLAQSRKCELDFETLEPRNLLAAVVVSTVEDFVSPTADTSSISSLIASDGGDGISLREAIVAANNTTGEDTIAFDESVFTGGENSVIRLVQGELAISDSLSIDGTSVGGVLITGDANGDDVTVAGSQVTDVSASSNSLADNSRVVNFSGTTKNLALRELTITGGRTSSFNDHGGGIVFNSSGSLNLTLSTISGNSTLGPDAKGGGIYTENGDVTLNNSVVSDNATIGESSNGGGIHTGTGNVSLTSSIISGQHHRRRS